MARQRRHSSEQAMDLLRQIEAGIASGRSIAESCMEAQVSKWMYRRWRIEHSEPEDGKAQRLRKLEQENANLRRLVSELCLHKQTLRDIIASGGF
jgi:putative transposase